MPPTLPSSSSPSTSESKPEALTLIDRIVRQGRGFGVHVLFGSQSLAGSASLPRPIMDQMGVRVALQCSEADSRIILAEDNPQARLLSRPGEAIYNDKDGMIEGNNRFQVAFLQDMVQEDILKQVAALAKEKGWSRAPIIFEGNAPAVFEVKNPLAPSLAGAWGGALRKIPAFVGEPIAIKEATAAYFKRQSGSNLLVVGQDESLSAAMLETAMLSVAAQVSPQHAQFVVLDFTPLENENVSPFEVLKEALPHAIQIGKRRELPSFLAALTTELQRRLDLETETASLPAIFLVIAGLQRARDLRSDDSSGFNFDEPVTESPAQILAKLLRDAPEFGIHTLISCDTVANLNRNLDRRSLGELDMRVVLQMSSDDSSNLIDSPAANKLGAHRALFYSPEEGRLEKFRPYRMLNANWVKQLGDFLKRKQTPVHA